MLDKNNAEDVADLAVETVYRIDNYVIDAVGPDIFTFREMIELIGRKISAQRPLIPVLPGLALLAARFLSLFEQDVLLTREELIGLMANLLVSNEQSRGKTRLADWLEANKDRVGARYASELKRQY
jgi:NADH dehydrogenase